ncbi:MAG TPA: hypothetical protein VJN89_02040 [Candidatus Acidoferrum sp.]|nr:hypothetical protein [Candidatus Acidoferrum sp.]
MKIILTMTVLAAMLTVFASTGAADEHSGTWKLNPTKSQFSPGPGIKNLTEIVALDESSYKVEANGTAADGTPIHIEFSAKFDGKDYPIIGVHWADTVSVTWTGAHEPQMIQKKGGQVTIVITCRVSADGKTRTCTLKGKDEQGRKVNNMVVFDRQ